MDTVKPQDSLPSRPIFGLFSDLWRETATLVREEAALAKAELSEKVSQVQSGIGSIAFGGAILFAGVLFLLSAAVAGLATVLPPEFAVWLAPLIVGAVVSLIGLMVLAKGRRNLRSTNLAPNRTAESLRRDAQLAREHVR